MTPRMFACGAKRTSRRLSEMSAFEPRNMHGFRLLPYAGGGVADFFDNGVNESIHSNVGRPDYLSPLLGVFNNEFAEVGRRHRFWNAADVSESRHYFGIGKHRIDLFVKLFCDLRGRVLRRDKAVLRANLVARYKLTNRRNIWQRLRTCLTGHCKGT